MMIQRTSFLLLLAAVLVSFSTLESVMPVDTARSTVTWHGSKMTGTHTGGLLVKEGKISVNEDAPVAARIVMDMRSITCTDITSESSNKKLVDHLNSPDFFHTEEHPTATFTSTSFAPIAASENYRVTGDLTIKGITHPTTFECTFVPEGDGYRAQGTLTFDRAKYEIKYRSGSFFEELGDKMIHDEVRLDLDLRTQ